MSTRLTEAAPGEDIHLDANVPGNPAYHFTILSPGSPSKAGWTLRPPMVPTARIATQCVHAGVQPPTTLGIFAV